MIKSLNNFKGYGFEADFQGEILKKITDKDKDTYFYGYIIIDEYAEPVCWDIKGNCYGSFDDCINNRVKEYKLNRITNGTRH